MISYIIIEFSLLYSSTHFFRSDNVTLREGVKETSKMFPDNIKMKQTSQNFSILYVAIKQKGYLGVNFSFEFLKFPSTIIFLFLIVK